MTRYPRVIVEDGLVYTQCPRTLDEVEADLVARGLHNPERIPPDAEAGLVFSPGVRTGKWVRLSSENLARLGLPANVCGHLPELLALRDEGFFAEP